jgi:hypothetical protein
MAFKVRNPQNFWSGILFIVVGIGYAYMARSYALGTVIEMGAGFFPFYLGLIMTGLGTLLVLLSLKTTGEAVGRFHWKPILWVIGSIVLFGFLLDILGVVVSGLVLVVGVSLGGSEFRWKHAVLLAVLLVAFSVLVFGVGLKLPIPLCPDFEWFKPFSFCRRL